MCTVRIVSYFAILNYHMDKYDNIHVLVLQYIFITYKYKNILQYTLEIITVYKLALFINYYTYITV